MIMLLDIGYLNIDISQNFDLRHTVEAARYISLQ